MSKYRSKKVTRDGITFDSKKECNRYFELKAMEQAGEIKNLQRQVVWELIPSQRDPETGKVIERPCRYVADFMYCKADNGELVVEDTKGFRTADYIIKRKLMLKVHRVRIKEI